MDLPTIVLGIAVVILTLRLRACSKRVNQLERDVTYLITGKMEIKR